ncbi:hypothetical protein CYY_005637 [Polysphondylium violaceum]|uniref:Pre-mRNA-splicing factor SPF27 n=1 Tax=Polysphondylium violaceum TaxID=133409 RepID=A0A8J4PUS0_9MYCE|nr:hypothetical protein CYY_005637 [Polysphondylium violaceum]
MKVVIEGSENIDSLPYVDPPIENGEQELINNMIKEEMSKFTPPDYLAQLPSYTDFDYDNFHFLNNEFDRLKAGKQMEAFDISRYKASAPAKQSDAEQWRVSIDNAKSQLEHQDLRKINLELLSKYGANSWKLYLSDLEIVQKTLKRQLEHQQLQIQEINVKRKLEQESTIERINQNQKKWLELVNKNREIEFACLQFENEIEKLKEQQHQSMAIDVDNQQQQQQQQ